MLTRGVLPRGLFKSTPEDFVVEEIPLYEPSGQGDHLYVRFTKRNLPTDVVVRTMARAVGVEARDVGVPGLKDKVGVTTQTISLPVPRGVDLEAKVRALALEGVSILDMRRHGNKLRTGHLAGNRFTVILRGVAEADVPVAIATLDRIGREGAPNAFGTQRFGKGGDNAERAQAWLRGEWSGPRDGRARRFLWSSLQSAIFNEVLRRRVEEGTWATPVAGDLLQKEDTGGLFLCADVQADRARAERGEVSPTGPMVGIKMRSPEGAALALEQEVTAHFLGASFDFSRVRQLGEGARRPFRTLVRELRAEPFEASGVRVCFVLPKGAYATTVLSHAFILDTCASEEVNAGGSSQVTREEGAPDAEDPHDPQE